MRATQLPTFFISHGGGPWPYIEELKTQYAKTTRELHQLARGLRTIPKAILVMTGHWEKPEFTVSTAEHPPMEYDYFGFPEHTYQIQYPAAGSPAIAARVRELLGKGVHCPNPPICSAPHIGGNGLLPPKWIIR